MHEDVTAAIIRHDEPVAFGVIEPLNSTGRHRSPLCNQREATREIALDFISSRPRIFPVPIDQVIEISPQTNLPGYQIYVQVEISQRTVG